MNTRKIAGFTWDKFNVEKLEVHGLCPDDAMGSGGDGIRAHQ
jgi:hypothetical protein